MAVNDHAALENLIAQIALGKQSAFSDLYDATSAKLMSVCLRVLKDPAAAEDAMQDAYIKVWKKADRYQVTGHSPMTWLITIARNTAIDRLRARQSTTDIDDVADRIVSSGPSPEEAAIASSEAGRISGCLDELEADRSTAVKGAYLSGQSYQELADQFKVPLNTMRTWLRRSLVSLRECMAR